MPNTNVQAPVIVRCSDGQMAMSQNEFKDLLDAGNVLHKLVYDRLSGTERNQRRTTSEYVPISMYQCHLSMVNCYPATWPCTWRGYLLMRNRVTNQTSPLKRISRSNVCLCLRQLWTRAFAQASHTATLQAIKNDYFRSILINLFPKRRSFTM